MTPIASIFAIYLMCIRLYRTYLYIPYIMYIHKYTDVSYALNEYIAVEREEIYD